MIQLNHSIFKILLNVSFKMYMAVFIVNSSHRVLCVYMKLLVRVIALLVRVIVVAMLQKNWFMLLAVRISSYGCIWEVWRALKKLEFFSVAPRATLSLLSCSPNFPRDSITRYTRAKLEPIF